MKAILFDWGNTLADYPLQHPEAQQGFFKEFLTGYLTSTDLLNHEALSRFIERFNEEAPDGQVRPFVQRLVSLWDEQLFGEMPEPGNLGLWEQHLCDSIFQQAILFNEALPTLKQLKARGFKIGILSNTPWGTSPTYWMDELERHGFAPGQGVVDTATFCGQVGYRKPNPVIFKHCVERLGVEPKEVLMVGDSYPSDILGARSAGLQTAWLQRNLHDTSSLKDSDTLHTLETLLTYHSPLQPA